MEKFLGSIIDLSRLPAALFIVDTMKEHIAVSEARKLNIPTFAITDTNTDPTEVDFAIPANDDATKSIAIIVETMVKAIEEGLAERKQDKEMEKEKEADTDADMTAEEGAAKAFAPADEEEPEVLTTAKPKSNLRPRKAGAGKPGAKKSAD